MIIRSQIFKRSLFALTAAAFCLFLSFRPIPSVFSNNDTGRYVEGFRGYCAGTVGENEEGKAVSYSLFYAAASPACLVKSNSLLLFEVAAFLPLIFLLFVKWRKGTLLWAYSLMFSMVGLELMTNAMRQSFAMFLLFGAIALLNRHRYVAFLLCVTAAAAHSSVLAYTPLFFWLAGVRMSKKTLKVGGTIVLLLCLPFILVFYASIIKFFTFESQVDFYSLIYVEKLNTSFILYMTLPLYWVYGVRYFKEKKNITGDERAGIIYSTGLMLICFIAFPAILYRFAIFAVVLQIFLVGRSDKPGLVAGGYVLFGMLLHLFVMLIFSNNYTVLING